MQIDRFIEELESIAPPDLAEDFDEGRIGLIIEGSPDIRRVCCALDVTPLVVDRTIAANADALVVHHTPFWEPMTTITGRHATLLRSLLGNEINVYVMHTNFDRARGGINDTLAQRLELREIETMSLGVVGTCTRSLDEMSAILGGNLQVYGSIPHLERLAVVGGSGFDPSLMSEAVHLGADAFLSAELKHSVALAAPLPLIEATHYALEAPGMHRLAERMGWEFIDDPPHIVLIQ